MDDVRRAWAKSRWVSDMNKRATPEENIRCIAFMVVAIAGVEDAVIKQSLHTMLISQIRDRWAVDFWNGRKRCRLVTDEMLENDFCSPLYVS